MSTGNPYNSLGQILSHGGEIAVGLALDHGWSDARLSTLIYARLRSAPGEETTKLISFAQSALDAGGFLTAMDNDDTVLDLEQIPINAGLFGDEPLGRRVHWEGEYRFGEGPWWRISGDFPDAPSRGEVIGKIHESADANQTTYRAKVGGATPEPDEPPDVRIILIERRF